MKHIIEFDLATNSDTYDTEKRELEKMLYADNYLQAIKEFTELLKHYNRIGDSMTLEKFTDKWHEILSNYKIDPWQD